MPPTVTMLHTVNHEYFASQIFRAIKFRVKSFSDKRPRTALSLIMRIFFVCLIFALAMLSENILTTKISRVYGTKNFKGAFSGLDANLYKNSGNYKPLETSSYSIIGIDYLPLPSN